MGRGQRYFRHGLRAVERGSFPPRESLMVTAFALLIENNFQGAISTWNEIIAEFPDDKEAYFWSGSMMYEMGDSRGGIALMKRALEIDPAYPFPLMTLMEAYIDLDDIPSAIRMSERYLNIRPDEMPPHLALAELYVRVGQFEQARSEYATAREIDPESIHVVRSMVSYFARIGQTDSIKESLRPFLTDRSNPRAMASANDRMGAALFLNGQFKESFRTFSSLVTMERSIGDSLAVARHLGKMASRYLLLGETDSAQSVFDRAYKIDPENFSLNDLPVRIAIKSGDVERARDLSNRFMDRILRILDEDGAERIRARQNTLFAYHAGDYAAALTEMLLIRELSQDPDDYSFWIGRSYLETGEAEKAKAELEHSTVRYDPLSTSGYWLYSWHYLGRAHEDLGNRGEATRAYRKFLHYWGRADRELPEILAAKERLARLTSVSP